MDALSLGDRHVRTKWNRIAPAALAAIAVGCWGLAGSTLVAQTQAQDGMPAAKRLASMKGVYQRPPPRAVENAALVDLGHRLFYDPRLSASGKTSCASCHYSWLGWGTTDIKSRNDSGKLTSRRSQPLLAIGHTEGPIG